MKTLRLISLLVLGATLTGEATEIPAARWEGTVQIPGREMRLIVDLAKDAGGAWIGSIIIPGFGVKGAVLTDVVVKNSDVSFSIKNVLGAPQPGTASFKARLAANGALAGQFLQAGNSAPFRLVRSGPPQVELPRRSTAVTKAFEGEWKGKYELMGSSRDVTLKLANPAGAGAASVDFVIVGKKVNNVPVDLVRQDGDFVFIESKAFGMTLEARLRGATGEIQGTLTQGPFEVPLTLRRTP